MPDLPFTIPESLASYLVQFESAPEKTIRRLKKQLKKRGPDAVAYFLLGWFYHRQGANEKAIDCALKAKTFAPGSPFLDKVHYYFTHPQLFGAWQTTSARNPRLFNQALPTDADPITNLNTLIEKLSAVESKRQIRQKEQDTSSTQSKNRTENFDNADVDDIVSETLAKIHEQQGKIQEAITTYQKLRNRRSEKKSYYSEQIDRLKKIKNDEK